MRLQQTHRRMLEAIAADNDDLAQVVSAPLMLHGPPDALAPGVELWSEVSDPRARQEAATVIRAFLGRALSSAA